MSARLTITGLDELRYALTHLPAQLAEEAEAIIDNRAELMKAEVYQRYPKRTGNLRKGLVIKDAARGVHVPGLRVVNRAAHAWLFENGTEARHTKLGADRGAMPPGRVFIPAAIRHRRLMVAELVAMLERNGLVIHV